MQTSWTFRGSGNRLTRKHVIMKIERLPVEEEVESKDYFGKQKSETGFVWKGTITIYMKKLPKGMTIRNLYDSEGEDFFDGEKVDNKKKEAKDKEEEDKPKPAEDDAKVRENDDNANDDGDNPKGNGAVKVKDDEDNKVKEVEVDQQIYDVELVISKEDPNDKDKDLKKRILSAMSSSSNASTPR